MNNRLKISVLFVAFLCLFTSSIIGQFSRNDAIGLVNSLLINDLDNVDLFSTYNSQTTAVVLIDDDSIVNPYSESWVFFSDDDPFASWYHASRIIFVSTVDGAYTINNVEIYPEGLQSDYEEISHAIRPEAVEIEGTAYVFDPERVKSNY